MSICFLKAIIPIHNKGNKTTQPKKLKNEYSENYLNPISLMEGFEFETEELPC